MLLALDIGNTNVVSGIFDGATLAARFRTTTQSRQTGDEAAWALRAFLERENVAASDINKVVIGSVVPALTDVYEAAAKGVFDVTPLIVSHRVKLPVRIEIDYPEQIGADRIANAVGAFARYQGPVIVVDFGTATTFDVVSADGAYIGGVIIPGPQTAMADLARKAARLFEVRLERPERVIGKSTRGALQSGMFYGTLGQVDFIIDRILEESGMATCTVIATGGLAAGIDTASRHITEVVPDITLEGLRLIGEMG